MDTSQPQAKGARIILCEIGFACFVTVMGRTLRDVQTLFAETGYSLLEVVLVPNAVNVAALLLAGLLCARLGVGRLRIRTYLASCACTVIGCACLFAFGPLVNDAYAIVVLCGAFFGVGGALGSIVWVCVFWTEEERAVGEVLSASFFGGVAGFALSTAGPLRTTLLVCVCLELLSLVCMAELASQHLRVDTTAAAIFERGRVLAAELKAVFEMVWLPALCIGTLGFMSAAARSMVPSPALRVSSSLTMVSEMAACFVLILLFARGLLRTETSSLYKFLFPVGALAYLVLNFAGERFVIGLAVISEFSFVMCSILVNLQALDYCKRLSCSPVVVYGLFSGLIHAVLSFGYPLVALGERGFDGSLYSLAAVVVIFILAMVLFLLPRHGGDTAAASPESEQGASAEGPSILTVVLPPELSSIVLSRREEEIVALILQGRDVPFIAERLQISKNTVRTHVKSLYAKFDVHGRQELIGLFDKE